MISQRALTVTGGTVTFLHPYTPESWADLDGRAS